MSLCKGLQHKLLIMYNVPQVYRISCLHNICYFDGIGKGREGVGEGRKVLEWEGRCWSGKEGVGVGGRCWSGKEGVGVGRKVLE